MQKNMYNNNISPKNGRKGKKDMAKERALGKLSQRQIRNSNNRRDKRQHYDNIGSFSEAGFAIVMLNKKFGMINRQGEEIIPAKYDFLWEFAKGGIARFEINKKYGLVNKKGEEIVPPKYDKIYDFVKGGLAIVILNGKYGIINRQGHEIIVPKYNLIFKLAGSDTEIYAKINDEKLARIKIKQQKVGEIEYI